MLVFTFFAKKNEGRQLSNFWEGEVVVDGRTYSTGEHAFHGSKYVVVAEHVGDEDRRKKLIEYGRQFEQGCAWGSCTPAEAKKKGGKKGMALTSEELGLWDKLSVDVQRQICAYKLETDDAVRKALIGTGDKTLVHPAMRCSLEKAKKCKWEGRVVEEDGRRMIVGGNMLGGIWMEMREGLVGN